MIRRILCTTHLTQKDHATTTMASPNSPLYDYSIVPFTRSIKNLLHCMGKAETYAKEKGENVDDYLQLQLYSDMKP